MLRFGNILFLLLLLFNRVMSIVNYIIALINSAFGFHFSNDQVTYKSLPRLRAGFSPPVASKARLFFKTTWISASVEVA